MNDNQWWVFVPFALIAVVLLLDAVPAIIRVVRFRRAKSWPCDTCKRDTLKTDLHEVLHGMGPESDCYVTYHCSKCLETERGFLMKHYLGRVS